MMPNRYTPVESLSLERERERETFITPEAQSIHRRGVRVNEFHHAAAPRNSGLFWCNSGAPHVPNALTVTVRERASVAPAGDATCIVTLVFVHSYEHFGPFTILVTPSNPHRPSVSTTLNATWTKKISVPEAQTAVTMKCSDAINASLTIEALPGTTQIAITSLIVSQAT